jgi:Mg2+/Co2+ transporter CorC
MDELRNNKNISQEDKDKILGIMKETFGRLPHMKDYFE